MDTPAVVLTSTVDGNTETEIVSGRAHLITVDIDALEVFEDYELGTYVELLAELAPFAEPDSTIGAAWKHAAALHERVTELLREKVLFDVANGIR